MNVFLWISIGLAGLALVVWMWCQGRRHHLVKTQQMAQGADQTDDLFLTRLSLSEGSERHLSSLQGLSKTWQGLGFGPWQGYELHGMHVDIEAASNGDVGVIVYRHPLFGQWFELWAKGAHTAVWSNSPLFNDNLVHPGVTLTHHRLMTVHDALLGAAERSMPVTLSVAEMMQDMIDLHDRSVWHFLSTRPHAIERTKINQWLLGFAPIPSQAGPSQAGVEVLLPSDPTWELVSIEQTIHHGQHPTQFKVVITQESSSRAAREEHHV